MVKARQGISAEGGETWWHETDGRRRHGQLFILGKNAVALLGRMNGRSTSTRSERADHVIVCFSVSDNGLY